MHKLFANFLMYFYMGNYFPPEAPLFKDQVNKTLLSLHIGLPEKSELGWAYCRMAFQRSKNILSRKLEALLLLLPA